CPGWGVLRSLRFRGAAGGGHSSRGVDVLLDVVVVTLARELLDHQAENDEAAVAVGPFRPGLEFQRVIDEELQVIVQFAQAVLFRMKRRAKNVAKPGRVGEEM